MRYRTSRTVSSYFSEPAEAGRHDPRDHLRADDADQPEQATMTAGTRDRAARRGASSWRPFGQQLPVGGDERGRAPLAQQVLQEVGIFSAARPRPDARAQRLAMTRSRTSPERRDSRMPEPTRAALRRDGAAVGGGGDSSPVPRRVPAPVRARAAGRRLASPPHQQDTPALPVTPAPRPRRTRRAPSWAEASRRVPGRVRHHHPDVAQAAQRVGAGARVGAVGGTAAVEGAELRLEMPCES